MSVRTQLVLALSLLAIVPLAGLTVYSYHSSQAAFRRAVEAEAAELATEMKTRVDTVKNDLDRRLHSVNPERLYALMKPDLGQVEADAEKAYEDCLVNLGDAASMIEAIEVRPWEGLSVPEPHQDALRNGRRPAPPTPPVPPVQPAPPVLKPEEAAGVVLYMPGTSDETSGQSVGEEVRDREFSIPGGRLIVKHRWKKPKGGAISSDPLLPSETGDLASFDREKLEMLREFSLEVIRSQEMMTEKIKADAERVKAESLKKLQEKAYKVAVTELPELSSRAGDGEPATRIGYFDFKSEVQRPGFPQGEIRARVSAKQVLASVMQQAEFKKGEIPFAIDRNGRLFTLDSEAAQVLKGIPLTPSQSAGAVEIPGEWLTVSKVHEASGIRFGIARPLGEGLRDVREAALKNFGYGLGIVGIAILGILPLSKRMTRNLTSLSLGARKLAEGNFDAEVPVRSNDEFGQLAKTFNQMARDLKANQARLVEQERIKKELEMCRQIQEEMLPRVPLRLPFAEVQGVSIPAREVGGDFFNYFSIDDERLAILIGDVSGKGVPAALLMANVQATLRARLPLTSDLAELVGELDREVSASTPMETYLTLFIGVVDAKRRTLDWVNAGHNTQYLVRSGASIEAMPSSGRPIGLLPGSCYEVKQVGLSDGDAIFLYTDGLVEAENSLGEDFGNARLETILRSPEPRKSAGILSRIEEEVRDFRCEGEDGDDATMLILRWSDQINSASV